MWLVEREHVGAVAYGRLQRDGAIRTLIPGLALPHDVPDSPSVRRHVLRRCIPVGCQVAGMAVLWAHGYCDLPGRVDVRTPVGRHVRNWTETVPLTFHSIGILSEEDRTPGFTGLAPAIADALRWSAGHTAVPAALNALNKAKAAGASDLATSVVAQIGSDAKAVALWARVQTALG